MPSKLIDQLRMIFHTTSNKHVNALANNYIYIHEDKISRLLICSICWNPLIDPQTHILCENSFCNYCIRKLRHCPYCRTSIMQLNDLKMTSDDLRNILDELQIQCNICKQILCRGDFDIHIRNNCLQHLSITPKIENNSTTNEKHLSNLYQRVHKLENELSELKKVIFLFLFVLSIIGTLVFFGAVFSYLTHLFLPLFVQALSKFLLRFSPILILFIIIIIK